MANYQLKSDILTHNPEFLKYIRDERSYVWARDTLWFDKTRQAKIMNARYQGAMYAGSLLSVAPELYEECNRMVTADTQRKKRLKKRIQRIFDKGRTYFVTLTFKNDALENLSADTRREYVTSFLKSISSDYVANIDFGSKSGREHYHAVIYCTLLDDIKYCYSIRYGWINIDAEPLMQWRKYGWFSVKSCGTDNIDKSRLAWYVSKLANHAVKETTKRNALIYSR